MCNTGHLTTIPKNFPNRTQEIVITNQNIREIPQKGEGEKKEDDTRVIRVVGGWAKRAKKCLTPQKSKILKSGPECP